MGQSVDEFATSVLGVERGKGMRRKQHLTNTRCACCAGTGSDLKLRTRCPVCGGYGKVRVDPPVVTCLICRGRGKTESLTCLSCKGVGVVSVSQEATTCPKCQGRGREGGGNFSCPRCKGQGMC